MGPCFVWYILDIIGKIYCKNMQKYAKTLDDMKGCKQPVKFNGFHIPLGKPIQITKINRFTESFDHRNVWRILDDLCDFKRTSAKNSWGPISRGILWAGFRKGYVIWTDMDMTWKSSTMLQNIYWFSKVWNDMDFQQFSWIADSLNNQVLPTMGPLPPHAWGFPKHSPPMFWDRETHSFSMKYSQIKI